MDEPADGGSRRILVTQPRVNHKGHFVRISKAVAIWLCACVRLLKMTHVRVRVWGILIIPSHAAAVPESSTPPLPPPTPRSQHLPHTMVVGKNRQGVKE